MVYPSSDLQEAAIRKAYQEANLDPSETNYVECHGTGTELGDKVELTALGSFFARDGTNLLKVGGVRKHSGMSTLVQYTNIRVQNSEQMESWTQRSSKWSHFPHQSVFELPAQHACANLWGPNPKPKT